MPGSTGSVLAHCATQMGPQEAASVFRVPPLLSQLHQPQPRQVRSAACAGWLLWDRAQGPGSGPPRLGTIAPSDELAWGRKDSWKLRAGEAGKALARIHPEGLKGKGTATGDIPRTKPGRRRQPATCPGGQEGMQEAVTRAPILGTSGEGGVFIFWTAMTCQCSDHPCVLSMPTEPA